MGNLGLSPKGSSFFPKEIGFSQGTIMSPGRRSINYPKEQLKLLFFREQSHLPKKNYFPFENMVASWGNLSLTPLGTWLFP
jgi:hypothetical protein